MIIPGAKDAQLRVFLAFRLGFTAWKLLAGEGIRRRGRDQTKSTVFAHKKVLILEASQDGASIH